MSDGSIELSPSHVTTVSVSYSAVLDTLPVIAYIASPEGELLYLSPTGKRLVGHETGTQQHAAVDPQDLARVLVAWHDAVAAEHAYTDHFRIRFADESYRWVQCEASPLRDTDNGTIIGWLGIYLDIDEQYRPEETAAHRAQEALVASELASRTLASAIPGVTWSASPDGKITNISDQWLRTHGSPIAATLIEAWEQHGHPDDREPVLTRWEYVSRSGEHFDVEFRLRVADESYRWFLMRARPVTDNRDSIVQWVGVNIDIDERHRADEERERVQRGFRLLAQTGAVALTSLESVAMTRSIARACVANFASLCSIDIVDESGKWERASAHMVPEFTALADDLPRPSRHHPIGRVLRSHHSSVITVTEEWISEIEGDSERAAFYRKLGMRSIISVPIATPSGDFVGALTCGIDASYVGNNYIPDDLVFVEEVGRRIGSLVENARLYERERRIAVELQAASLPATLPRIDHLHLDAEYRPGSAEATIGGDWYDAFILRDGRVAITVGDVLGHGLRAAVTMTKLRQAMQAAAMIDPNPNMMLRVADETLKLIDPDEGFATAIALIFDPAIHEIAFASAGHPGPVLRSVDGTVRDLACPGMMLGLRSGDEDDLQRASTPRGTSFVLFTDGITEATRDMNEGYTNLHDAIGDVALLHGNAPAKHLVERVLGDTPASDDIAVLVATVSSPEVQQASQTRYGRTLDEFPAAPLLPGVRTSSWQFDSSDAESAHAVRHSFLAYAAGSSKFTERVDLATAELVLGELIGNVVRHAPGLVTVDIEWRHDQICIAVNNDGAIFALPSPRPPDLLRESGRGLEIIAQCTSSLRVVGTASGGCRVEAVVPHLPR